MGGKFKVEKINGNSSYLKVKKNFRNTKVGNKSIAGRHFYENQSQFIFNTNSKSVFTL